MAEALRTARRDDGQLLFTLPVAVSLVVFFALCCQCGATLAVMRRETGSWGWPLLAFVYMTSLAWLGAWLSAMLCQVWMS
jgi:ferrous iron transport protein B